MDRGLRKALLENRKWIIRRVFEKNRRVGYDSGTDDNKGSEFAGMDQLAGQQLSNPDGSDTEGLLSRLIRRIFR